MKLHLQSIFIRIFSITFILMACLFSMSMFSDAANAAEVTLAWDANSEENLAGYKLYYKSDTGGVPYNGTGISEGVSPITIYLEELADSNAPVFSLSGLGDGQLYFFSLTAFDTDGLESDYSDEVFYEVPGSSPVTNYSMTATATGQGEISPEGTLTAAAGSSQAYTITPAANYHVVNVIVDGSSVGKVAAYSFENISASHTIQAVFEIETFTISASAGANGTITPVGTTPAAYGTSQAYTITPAANYHIANVIVDGSSVGQVAAYSFENISAAHTIEAVFEIDIFSIIASATGNGTITPEGSLDVAYGTDLVCTMTPDAGCEIEAVLVDGNSIGVVETYTVSNIAENHTIEVIFAEIVAEFTMEVGEVVADSEWQQVSFDRTFVNPVVVVSSQSINEVESAEVRIRNVTPGEFEISVRKWNVLAGEDMTETVGYVVMEAGSFILPDGSVVEAGTIGTEDVSSVTDVAFTGDFNQIPVTGAAIASYNDSDAVMVSLLNIDSTGFQYQLLEQEGDTDGHLSETVSYIAWESFEVPLDDAMIEAGITEEVMNIAVEILKFSQPSAYAEDTGSTEEDTGSTEDGGTDTGAGDIPDSPDPDPQAGENHVPDRPVPMSFTLEAAEVGPMGLTVGGFNDPDAGDYHLKTEWQIFRTEDGVCVLSAVSTVSLTRIRVPDIMLEENSEYTWQARFFDNHDAASEWSETVYFTTGMSDTDTNGNGIPDGQETDDSVDLNGDGISDAEQEIIKSIMVAANNKPIGLSIESAGTVTAILAMEVMDPEALDLSSEDEAQLNDLPYGLINFKMTVAQPGDTAVVTVCFAESIPESARWLKYDPIQGVWLDYSGYTQLSDDRMSLTLELVDGGFGDDDGVANGIIIDPAGLEFMLAEETPAEESTFSAVRAVSMVSTENETSGGGGGCFITGSMEDSAVNFPMAAAGILMLLGGAIVRHSREQKQRQ